MQTKTLYARIYGSREDTEETINLSIMNCPHCNNLAQPNVVIPNFDKEDKKKFESGKEVTIPGSYPVSLKCFTCGVTVSLPFKIRNIQIQKK